MAPISCQFCVSHSCKLGCYKSCSNSCHTQPVLLGTQWAAAPGLSLLIAHKKHLLYCRPSRQSLRQRTLVRKQHSLPQPRRRLGSAPSQLHLLHLHLQSMLARQARLPRAAQLLLRLLRRQRRRPVQQSMAGSRLSRRPSISCSSQRRKKGRTAGKTRTQQALR